MKSFEMVPADFVSRLEQSVRLKLSRRKIDRTPFRIYLALTRQREYCQNGEKFAMAHRVCKDRELYALQRVHKSKFAAGPSSLLVLDACQTDIYYTCMYNLRTYVSYPLLLFSIILILPHGIQLFFFYIISYRFSCCRKRTILIKLFLGFLDYFRWI